MDITYGASKINQAMSDGLYITALVRINEREENLSMMDEALLLEEIGEQIGPIPFLFLDNNKGRVIKSSYDLMADSIKLTLSGRSSEAIEVLELGSPTSNEFSLQLGNLYLQRNNYKKANEQFEKCLKAKSYGVWGKRVKTMCQIALARVQLELKNYSKSAELYGAIDKRDALWPTTLWENGWNFYHLKNYNRVLGLSVTYNAPLLKEFFYPEAFYLSALSYSELCLYGDAEKKIDEYLTVIRPRIDKLAKMKVNFTELDRAKWSEHFSEYEMNILESTFTTLNRSLYFHHIQKTIRQIERELEVKKSTQLQVVNKKLKKELEKLFKSELNALSEETERIAYELTNLKLTILSQKKGLLYDEKALISQRARGSYENVDRKTTQYFFDFRGEFWADELGDYSFGLKSNCETVTTEVAYENR